MPNDQQDDDVGKINLDEIDTETAQPEQVDAVIKVAKSALVQRAKYKDLAIDPETKRPYKDLLAEARGKQPNTPETPVSTTKDTPATDTGKDVTDRLRNLEIVEEKRQFGHKHSLSPEETDYAFAIAQGQGKKAEDIINDDFFKSGIDSLRQKRKVESATPTPSSRSPQVDGKPLSEAKDEDVRKNWQKITGYDKS